MASLGHIAVGMAAARLAVPDDARPRDRALAMGLLSLVSMAPDADVLAFALHVPYHAPFGHRGAVHSLALSCALGAVAGAVLGWRRFPRWRAALAAGLVAASHGLLDTLTDGGLGIALLWPFSAHRFFAPWQPIPVAPIGTAFLSTRGMSVAAAELALFAPVFIFALWPRGRGKRSRERQPA